MRRDATVCERMSLREIHDKALQMFSSHYIHERKYIYYSMPF